MKQPASSRSLLPIVLIMILLVRIVADFPALTMPGAARPEVSTDDSAATKALGLVNEWRISEGLVPLRLNPVLQQMAQEQADFVFPIYKNIENEEDYHKDARGRTPIKRAIENFKWPSYGILERVEIGENAAQSSVKGAVEFWKESPIHRKTATNPTYREVGIVALPLKVKGTFLFYMDFGARPGSLTAMYSPDDESVYLSRENSRYSKEKNIQATIQFFDEDRKPLSEPTKYVNQTKVPAGAGNRFNVKYTVGENESWVLIDRTRDQIIRPNRPMTVQNQVVAVAASSTPPPAVVQASTNTPTSSSPVFTTTPNSQNPPAPSREPLGLPKASTATQTQPPPTLTNTPIATKIKARGTVLPTNTQRPTITPAPPTNTPIVQPSATFTPIGGERPFTLYYNSRALFIFNNSKRSIRIDGLRVGRLTTKSFESVVALPSAGLPATSCLGVGLVGDDQPSPPSACRLVWVQMYIGMERAFWTQGNFDVAWNDVIIQTCGSNAVQSQCTFKLP